MFDIFCNSTYAVLWIDSNILKRYLEYVMNERIKELAEQAKKYALDAMIKITDKEQALKVYSESYDTKFAELIVRECADIAKHNVMNISTYSDAEFVSDLIHQNFGVK